MSSCKENVIQEAVEEFTGALQTALPLEHFSQFHDGPHLDKVAKQKSKEILANVQANSELEVEEAVAVANELLPKFQEVIRKCKAKNGENKTKCDQFLQGQVDFLLADFSASTVIKLVSAPDVGLEDLKTFLKGRKILLIDIFDKLTKPGEPQSCVDMKTKLIEKLECVRIETLDKQRLHLEKKENDMAKKVLEDAKGKVMNIAMQLKTDLNAYRGEDPKELVRGKLAEINYFLSMNVEPLKKYHPSIHSAVLRTAAEVRKCLGEKDYQEMSADEFADTLHEQLLFDFAHESHARENASVMDFDSIISSDESACENSGNEEQAELIVPPRHEICVNRSESEQCVQKELQIDFAEEGVKEEKREESGLDQDQMNLQKSNHEAAVIPSGDDGDNFERTGYNGMEQSSVHISRSGLENLSKSKKLAFKTTTNAGGSISRRRSARLQRSSKIAAANNSESERKRQRSVVEIPETMDRDDESFEMMGANCEDSITNDCDNEEMNPSSPQRTQAGSGKLNGRKLRQTEKRHLSDDEGNACAEKMTYLYLQNGRPIYLCNVCKRKCPQSLAQYHGEYCGKSDDPFACKDCGKSFIGKRNLLRHSRVHTGEKPFKCSKCSERFADKGNLNKHFRLHARGARFHCKACKLSFISAWRFHDHNISMHKDKLPFGCRYCDERFSSVPILKYHVVTHADIRPFQCATCDASFARKSVLVLHIQRVHSYSAQAAQKLANEAAIAYLVKETKDESYRHTSEDRINSLVVSHVIKKENLKLPKRAKRNRKSTVHA